MDVFLSGLGGALVGSVIGFLGSWWLQRRALQHDERGAARALYFEMVTNSATLRRASEIGPEPGDRLAYSTWEAAQSRVGALLEPDELMAVAQAYAYLPLCQASLDEIVRTRATSAVNHDALVGGADLFHSAHELLRARAWSRHGQAKLATSVHETMQSLPADSAATHGPVKRARRASPRPRR